MLVRLLPRVPAAVARFTAPPLSQLPQTTQAQPQHQHQRRGARSVRNACVRDLPLIGQDNVVFPGEQTELRLSEPRHQIMCRDIMGRPPHSRRVGVVKRKEEYELDDMLQGDTDYRAEEIGTLMEVESVTTKTEPLNQLLNAKAIGRFRVVQKQRLPWGYWSCTAAIVQDEPCTPQAEVESTRVKELLWTYAQYSLMLDSKKLRAFERRLNTKAAEDPSTFSLWVAMQLRTRLAHDGEGRTTCQQLLEARSASKRLEMCRSVLEQRLQKVDVPFDASPANTTSSASQS